MYKFKNDKIALINPESPSYLFDLECAFKSVLITPYKEANCVIEELIAEFMIQEIMSIELLDSITRATLEALPVNLANISKIYVVEANEKSREFYDFFHEKYEFNPTIRIIHNEHNDTLYSNCMMLEIYMKILRGIDEREIECSSIHYRNYLNSIYMFNLCWKDCF